ncbi:hypothetical protein [Cyanobacterium aponinum]|uniref:Uncharacterized protein n=1 Tax=Cyanobacterium aponinum 0216 TaxID=2676140 RepID=A0A844GW04_9CHRO|nr:hypothetical protein [Cyanobacterium aponinum]MTF40330.1 hypothetical protein [Cyanobacterium aponinum 0216]
MINDFGYGIIPMPYSKQQNEQNNNDPNKILSSNIKDKEIEKEATIEKEKLQIELEKCQFQVSEIQNHLSISNKRNNELKNQLENVNQYNIQLKTELSEAKAEIEKLNNKLSKIKSQGDKNDIFDCFNQ